MDEKSEFIGKKITITDSSNKELLELSGIVIDETKNTMTIKCDGKNKKLIKDEITFTINGKKIIGKSVSLRPEERIKRIKKQ